MNIIKKSAVFTMLIALFITAIAGFVKYSPPKINTEGGQFLSGKTINENLLKGASEYYYTGEQDGKVWHVMNLYSQANNSGIEDYNNSYYDFRNDTVTVINRIVIAGKNESETNLALIP